MKPLKFFLPLSLLSLTATYRCIAPHHSLPEARHCHLLIDALEILSVNPPYNTPLRWSRNVQDTHTTLRLPKSYRLISTFPNTCAIHVDTIPDDTTAQDTFAISNVGNMAEILVEQCLVRQQKLGWGFPGPRANIQLSIIRADGWWSRGEGSFRTIGEGLLEWTEALPGLKNQTAEVRNGSTEWLAEER